MDTCIVSRRHRARRREIVAGAGAGRASAGVRSLVQVAVQLGEEQLLIVKKQVLVVGVGEL